MSTLENKRESFNSIEILSKYELTLESCLSKFVAEEVYPDYNWDACGEVSNCIMKTKISILPKYFIIQLMRFESVYTATQTVLTKNNEFIKFPTKDLDLNNFYSGDNSESNCIYDLCGVIHHSGTMDFFHHYAAIKNHTSSEDWYFFNGNFLLSFIKLFEKILIV